MNGNETTSMPVFMLNRLLLVGNNFKSTCVFEDVDVGGCRMPILNPVKLDRSMRVHPGPNVHSSVATGVLDLGEVLVVTKSSGPVKLENCDFCMFSAVNRG